MHRILFIGTALFAAAAQAPQAPPVPPPPPVHAGAVLTHLKQTIAWFRHVTLVEQTPGLANDVLLRDSTHESAVKALGLAFEFGHNAAALLDTSGDAAVSNTATPQRQNLTQAAARAAARVDGLQTRLKDVTTAIDAAKKAADRDTLIAQRHSIEAQLKLATEVRDTVKSLAAFSPSAGTAGLAAQVDELERSIPEAPRGAAPAGTRASAPASAAASSATAPAPFHPDSSGIIGLGAELFSLSHNRRQIHDLITNTDELTREIDRLRMPLLNEVRSLVRRSEELGSSPDVDEAQEFTATQHEIESLTARFKLLSAVLVPLGQQAIVLGPLRGNLTQAVDGVTSQYGETARYLLLRLTILALAIGFVMLLSTLWRRVTFRYVRDPRRRTQFLTLRRVLVACGISVIVLLSFITEFGSLATYAGLLTAGIAVALQNVILSVVAYFFLIGRYGVRSGDRVTISGVTGNVIDIGLVRIYLAELTGADGELRPTGRVVVSSHSILFQPSALFKQLSGTDYVWHMVRLVLVPESELRLAETRVTEAVNSVYERFRKDVAPQLEFEHAHTPIAEPSPEVRLRSTNEGLEVTVRYPAPMKNAAATDEEVLQSIRETLARDPKLSLTEAGAPAVVANVA